MSFSQVFGHKYKLNVDADGGTRGIGLKIQG